MLLLHGNPGTSADWTALAPLLSSLGHVAALDLPGFGVSDGWPVGKPKDAQHEDAQPEDVLGLLAETAVAWLDAEGWHEPVVVIGHSHGGAVAQTIAARYPQRVSSLVVVASLGVGPHLGYRLIQRQSLGSVVALGAGVLSEPSMTWARDALVASIARLAFWPAKPFGWWKRQLRVFLARPAAVRWMVTQAQQSPSHQLRRDSSRLTCPCLLLHGDRDRVIPIRYALALFEAIRAGSPQSEIVILHGCGHMLPMSDPVPVMTRIGTWLTRVEGPWSVDLPN
jgi:pimeloyl-ACP methyl ester carboxylesterase